MIHHGDCLEVMAAMEPESVDAIVTDPPYGLEFMGKEWDKLVSDMPNAAAWAGRRGTKRMEKGDEETGPTNPWGKEATGYRGGERHGSKRCRICGKRQFSGTPCKCPEPDWETVYPSGPPSGAVAMGRWHQRWAEAAYRVAKPSAYLLAFGGTRTVHRMTVALEDAGWIIRDMLVWAYASGFPKSKASLKPAWEPIVMARKPGPLRMLAIDECRIGTTKDVPASTSDRFGANGIYNTGLPALDDRPGMDPNLGRWPANVILTDPIFDGGVEGVVGGGETGPMPSPYVRSVASGNVNAYAPSIGDPAGGTAIGYGDVGGYSRFFLVPKAARIEREPTLGPIARGSGDLADSGAGLGGATAAKVSRLNVHPTVKPTELMRHLVRLVTPPGGTALDPFLGSGTTGLACELEGFPWIGIEKEAEYVAIAEARLNGTQRGLGLAG